MAPLSAVSFPYELLEAVARRTDDELRSALDQLVAAGLVFRRGVPPDVWFSFKHALVQDAAYSTLLRVAARYFTPPSRRLSKSNWRLSAREAAAGEHAALLAHHWIRAEHWEKALNYTLDAAKRAEKLYARPEAISHYWQALELIDRLPRDAKQSRLHAEVILLLGEQPGWMRDDTGKATMEVHIDRALAEAAQAGDLGILSRLEALKAFNWNNKSLFIRAIERLADLQDTGAQAYATEKYGAYLGRRGKFEESLAHCARAIDLMGVLGKRVEQGLLMAGQGRCYCARAGRLGNRSNTPPGSGKPVMLSMMHYCGPGVQWKPKPTCIGAIGMR